MYEPEDPLAVFKGVMNAITMMAIITGIGVLIWLVWKAFHA